MSNKQENATVIKSAADQEFIVNNGLSNLAANENLVNVRTFETCFYQRIDMGMANIVDMVEDRTEDAILSANDCFITPKIELAIRSKN